MTVACCLHRVLEIQRTPRETWRAACLALPTVCPEPAGRCSPGAYCRRVVAESLSVPYLVLGSGWRPKDSEDANAAPRSLPFKPRRAGE
jgi:hypothetical protein